MGRGSAQPRPTPPALTLIQGRPAAPPEQRRASWALLWPAWRNLTQWEERIDAEFGTDLGEDMLVLWALLRFGGSRDLEGILKELVNDDLEPTFGGTLMQDIVSVAFALGAAWAGSNEGPGEHAEPVPPLPHVVP